MTMHITNHAINGPSSWHHDGSDNIIYIYPRRSIVAIVNRSDDHIYIGPTRVTQSYAWHLRTRGERVHES